jgi:imidazolonepropionase-like amidohydrolase
MARVLFRGGRLFDGSGAALREVDIAVEDGVIRDVGRGLDGDTDIDVSGQAVLPGLFDCHVHVCVSHVDLWRHAQTPFSLRFYEAARNLRATLHAGVTSIRDASGADLGIKTAIQSGMIPGPRMQIAIRMLSQTGGHGDGTLPSGVCFQLVPAYPGMPPGIVDGPDEMRRRVRELVREGADVIKVATSGGVLSPRDNPRHAHFRPSELEVLVEEASAAGLFVMAHAQATDGIKNAVRAGIRSIEHGIYLDDEAIQLMLDRGAFLVPTLVAPEGVLDAADQGVRFPLAVLDKAKEVIDVHRESFRRAVAAGVRIAMGTDSGVSPHGRNLRELELMRQGGMSPEQVLVATTRTAAELLGVADKLGTIEPGKRADLVLVEGDPFEFVTLPGRIRAVYIDGRAATDLQPEREAVTA